MSADFWTYLDAQSNTKRGPLPEKIIKRLIRKGIVQPDHLAWTQRLSEWKPLQETDTFAAYCAIWKYSWHYLAENQNQLGPITTKQLLEQFADGAINGLTMVWTSTMGSSWLSLRDVDFLREFLDEVNAEIEQMEALKMQEQAIADSDKVYREESVDCFVAEDGKDYVFDREIKQYIRPAEKIDEELRALCEKNLDSDNEDEMTEQLELERAAMKKAKPLTVAEMSLAGEKSQQKRKRKKKSNKWKSSKQKNWIYVNGLPLDISVQEVHEYFTKCGIIQKDVVTEEPRVKLYQNKEQGGINGDASICYMKEASVELAVQLLDKTEIRPNWPIDVSPAVFTQKGDEFVHKKVKLNARSKVKRLEQEKALSWNEGEDGDRLGMRIVVLKHLFRPEEITDPSYEQELLEDIEAECTKIGEISKVTIFSKREDGVVVVKFASSGSAAKCIEVMNGRYFAGRTVECHFWDGTDYTYRESKEEEKVRADAFSEWLEGGSEDDDEEESKNQPTALYDEEVHAERLPATHD